MATPQTAAPDTLPAGFFASGGASAPDTLPANFFAQAGAPSTLPADFFKSAAPATLPANFFSPPAHDPTDRFGSSGVGEARAYTPSIWDRIKSAVTAGIPRYSSRTVNNPKYGDMQILSPEEALTPSEQRAHPMVTGIGEAAGGLTSPSSVALLAGTAGLGELPGAAAMLPRLMSADFGAQSIYAAAKSYPEIRSAIERGDIPETERLLTHAVLNLGMAAAAGQHAVTGAGAVTGKTNETATPGVETRAVEPTSPVGEVLKEHAPSVRVADNAALARQLTEDDTAIRPVQEVERRATPRNAPMSARELDQAIKGRKPVTTPFDETEGARDTMNRDLETKRLGTPRTQPEVNTQAASDWHNEALEMAKEKLGPKASISDVLQEAAKIQKEGPEQLSINGSGESGASQEAINRVASEKTQGIKTYRVDTRSGREVPISGVDAVDAAAGPFERIIQRAADGSETELDAGAKALPDRLQARVEAPRDTAAFRNRNAARVVSDNHIPVVSKDEILSQSVHNIISNSGELSRAGIDLSSIKTTGDIDAVLQRATDLVKSNLDPRAAATIGFEAQRQLASDRNMSLEELLSRRSGQAFSAEEAIASRAILKQSASNVLRLSQLAAQTGDSARIEDGMTALAQHQAIQEQVVAGRAEAGRALGSFRIKEDLPEVKIANVFSKMKPEAQAEAMRLLSKFDPSDPQTVRRLSQFTEKIKPSTPAERLFEYYRNSMLSSPHTIIVKTASEAAMVAMEGMKKAIAGGLAKFKDSPDRFSSESYYYAKGMAQALAEHARTILSGEFQLQGSPGFERAGQQAIKGRIGSVVRAPSEAMSRMTNLLYAGNFMGELNALAARRALAEGLEGDEFHARQEYLSHHPTESMSEAAHELATKNTFQSRLGKWGEKAGQFIDTKPSAAWLPESLKSTSPLRWLLPFYKTPVNLLKASVTHATPYELLNGIAKGDTDAMARGVLGSSISGALAFLALSGHITGGGPIDFKKEETLRATGWQPYSLKIGDKYYSYHRWEPVGLVAGLIADTVHGMKTGDSEVVTSSKVDSAIRHIARNLDDFPFMGTLANLLQAVHDPVGGRARSFINREAASLIPAGIANIAEALDPVVRRPKTALQAIEARIPGMTSSASPIIDIRGNQVQRPINSLGGGNPFPVSTSKGDPVLDALAALGISTPQPPQKLKWRGREVELTPQEREQFSHEEGAEFYKRVSKVMHSDAWSNRSDDQKRKALVALHHMIDEYRPARLTRLRRQAVTRD